MSFFSDEKLIQCEHDKVKNLTRVKINQRLVECVSLTLKYGITHCSIFMLNRSPDICCKFIVAITAVS